jgi:hypothetical protein
VVALFASRARSGWRAGTIAHLAHQDTSIEWIFEVARIKFESSRVMPRAWCKLRKLLFGLPWISCALAPGCQLITGASERRFVESDEGGSCGPGEARCDVSGRKECDLTGNYRNDPCPADKPLCTGDGVCACAEPVDDRNLCTLDECKRGMLSHTPLDGTPCTAGGTCALGLCMGGPCKNGKQDGVETDVDCGGGECPPCDDGQPCKRVEDCESGFCSFCTDLANCELCSANCTDATCGSPPILIYNARCFGLIVLRNGQVVESQSTEGLCENEDRKVRTRLGDQTFLFVKDPTSHIASVYATSGDDRAQNWSGRCVGAFPNRAALVAEAQRLEPVWTPRMTAAGWPVLSMFCDTAALYKW